MHTLIEKSDQIRRDLLEYLKNDRGRPNKSPVLQIFNKFGVDSEWNLVNDFLKKMQSEDLIDYISTKGGFHASITLGGIKYFESKSGQEYFSPSEQEAVSDILDRITKLEEFQKALVAHGFEVEKDIEDIKRMLPSQRKPLIANQIRGLIFYVLGAEAYSFFREQVLPIINIKGLLP